MAQEEFPERLMPVIGKPAATLFIEDGTERHFLLEAAFFAVATFLGGKFLDGFADGLGVTDVGKAVGAEVKQALVAVAALMLGTTPGVETELKRLAGVLQGAADKLSAYAANVAARSQAEDAVRLALQDKGLPAAEARRIAKAVGAQMLPTPPGGAGHG